MSEQFFRHHVVSLYGAIDVVSVDAYWKKSKLLSFGFNKKMSRMAALFKTWRYEFICNVSDFDYKVQFCHKINRNIFLTFVCN